MALADIDNDGDLDLYVANGDGPANKLYLNPHNSFHTWLLIRPLSPTSTHTLHGAQVRLTLAGTATLVAVRSLDGGSGFCSQNAYDAHFGLGHLPASQKYDVSVRAPGSGEFTTIASGISTAIPG